MGGISIEGPKILFQLPFFGGLNITETVVTSWLIILAVFILCKFLTHNLEKIPTKKRQQLAEKAVIMIDKLVADTMGERNMAYAPYLMTLMVFSLLGSLSHRHGEQRGGEQGDYKQKFLFHRVFIKLRFLGSFPDPTEWITEKRPGIFSCSTTKISKFRHLQRFIF